MQCPDSSGQHSRKFVIGRYRKRNVKLLKILISYFGQQKHKLSLLILYKQYCIVYNNLSPTFLTYKLCSLLQLKKNPIKACNTNTLTYNRSIKATQACQIMGTIDWELTVWRWCLSGPPPLQGGMQVLQKLRALQWPSWYLQIDQQQLQTSVCSTMIQVNVSSHWLDWITSYR